jgi:predicted Zn-dependent protease
MKSLPLVVVAGTLLATSAADSATPAVVVKDDPVLQAMHDELARYQSLKLASLDAPYYLSATIDDAKTFSVEASFGALQSRDEGTHRNAHVVVHVGTPELDDQNFVDREHFNFGSFMADMVASPVPNEPDYDALRQALWLRFDSSYKNAVETIARKRAFLATNEVKDRPSDFTDAEVAQVVMPTAVLQVDEERWTKLVQDASAVFRNQPHLLTGTAMLRAFTENQRFASSDAALHRFGDTTVELVLHASAQAEDGMELNAEYEVRGRSEKDLPKDAVIIAAAQELSDRLRALMAAPILPEDYTGPVLFTGQAAARFFLTTVGDGLSSPRTMLGEERRGRIVDHIGKHIASKLLSVTDDPTQRTWHGQPLLGWFPADDQGVKPEHITLVDKGVLKTCYMSRVPTTDVHHTNGHARGGSASVGNLIVRGEQTLSRAALKKKLIEEAKDADLEYGLLVEELGSTDTAQAGMFMRMMGRGDEETVRFPEPLRVFRVFLDGREELVRGANFKPASFRVLEDIDAIGSDTAVLNTTQAGQSVSVVAPSVLVKRLDLNKPKREFDRLPAIARPVASTSP